MDQGLGLMPKPTKKQSPKFQEPKFQDPLQTGPMDLPEPARSGAAPSPQLRKATAVQTARALGKISPTAQMRDLMSRMRDIGGDEKTGAVDEIPEPVTPTTLPSVIGKQMVASGFQSPEFHAVSNLPGNMQRGIRILGRALFGSMTRTPIKDITVIANVAGQGPNTPKEINAVTKWVREHGKDLGPGNIDFGGVLPGYQANINQYTAGGARWLLVQDPFGRYIYTWPEQDSLDSTDRISEPTPRRLG